MYILKYIIYNQYTRFYSLFLKRSTVYGLLLIVFGLFSYAYCNYIKVKRAGFLYETRVPAVYPWSVSDPFFLSDLTPAD